MKGGGMQRAHIAEHAVDLETGAVVAGALHPATASRGDTQTVPLTRFVSPLLGWGLGCWPGRNSEKNGVKIARALGRLPTLQRSRVGTVRWSSSFVRDRL